MNATYLVFLVFVLVLGALGHYFVAKEKKEEAAAAAAKEAGETKNV